MYFMFRGLMFTKVFPFYLNKNLLCTDDYRKLIRQVTGLFQLKYNFHEYVEYRYQQIVFILTMFPFFYWF